MTTTTLADRLRALADFTETHNLPEPYVTISGADYGTLRLSSHDELCRWADVLAKDVHVLDVTPADGREPFTAYSVNTAIGGQNWHLAFYDRLEAVA